MKRKYFFDLITFSLHSLISLGIFGIVVDFDVGLFFTSSLVCFTNKQPKNRAGNDANESVSKKNSQL